MGTKKKGNLKAVETATNGSTAATTKMGYLLSKEFNAGLRVLMECPTLTIKTALIVMKIQRQVEEHQKNYNSLRLKLIDKYAAKDEKGEAQTTEDKQSYVLSDPAGFNREYEELMLLDVEVTTIPVTCVEDVVLAPSTVTLLMKTVLSA